MTFQFPTLQDQQPLDFAWRGGLYAVSGALASRVTALTVMQGAFAGLANGLSVQLGHTALKTDDTAFQKTLAYMTPLALSTVLMAALAGRLHLPLNFTGAITLFLFNTAGEAVKTVLINLLAAPVIPEKEEDVKDLSEAGVSKLHEDYANQKVKIGAKALPELHRRFYEFGLPLPEGKKFTEMKATGETFEITEIALPQTVEAAQALSDDQLSWLAFSLIQHKGVTKLDFKTQVALQRAMATKVGLQFSVIPKNAADVHSLNPKDDKDILELLHQRYIVDSLKWLGTAEDVKQALNAKFLLIGKATLSTTRSMPKLLQNLKKKTREQFMEVYNYYDNHREEYTNLDHVLKFEIKEMISKFNLSPLS